MVVLQLAHSYRALICTVYYAHARAVKIVMNIIISLRIVMNIIISLRFVLHAAVCSLVIVHSCIL